MRGIVQHAVLASFLAIFAVSGVGYVAVSNAAVPTGKIVFRVKDEAGNGVGGVQIWLDAPGGFHCGGSASPTDTTGPLGNSTFECKSLANPGALPNSPSYTIKQIAKDGYSLSSRNTHPIGDTVRVWKGVPNEVEIILKKDAAPAPPPAQAPALAPSAPAPPQNSSPPPNTASLSPNVFNPDSTPTGKIVFRVKDEAGTGVGGVQIKLGSPGNYHCGGQTTPSDTTGSLGNSTFECKSLAEAGALPNAPKYTIKAITKDGYSLSPKNMHPIGDTIRVWKGVTNEVNIILKKNPAPAQQPTAGSPSPNTGSGSAPAGNQPAPAPAATPNVPDSQKKGSIQITAYQIRSNGAKSRLGGVKINTQAVGYPAGEEDRNCTDYNQTTRAEGTNLGVADFNRCWTGAGNVAYQLSSIQAPSGYTYKSYHITGPGNATFTSGQKSTSLGIAEQFTVTANATVKLELWFDKQEQNQAVLADVKQVFNQQGASFKPANETPAAISTATALNSLFGVGRVNVADLDQEITEEADEEILDDVNPPSRPENFKANQDESGSISLRWNSSRAERDDEVIAYNIERSLKNSDSTPESIADFIEDLNALDDSENLEYPATYVYRLWAIDDSGNESEPAVVEIITKDLTPNVPADLPEEAGEEAVIDHQELGAAIILPEEATNEDLSCDISSSDSTGRDMLTDLGEDSELYFTPVCRNDDGELMEEFEEDVEIYFEIDEEEWSEDMELYGFDGTDWGVVELNAETSIDGGGVLGYNYATMKKTETKTIYSVKGKKIFSLALVRSKSSSAISPITMGAIVVIILTFLIVRFQIRRNLEAQFAAPYGDVDLLPLRQSMPSQPTQPTQQPIVNDREWWRR